jgi:hypothetical protein
MKHGNDVETGNADSEGVQPRDRLIRRGFLALAAVSVTGVAVGVGAPATIFGQYRPASLRLEIARQGYHRYRHARLPLAEAITEHFDYLTIDASAAERFAEDYQALMKKRNHTDPLDEIYTLFLLSTDFFLNGADESSVVNYVLLFDPHESKCFNPFATFV